MQPNNQNSKQPQNIDIPSQPSTTNALNTSLARPTGGLTLQPFSSEDDIRSEVQTAQPTPSTETVSSEGGANPISPTNTVGPIESFSDASTTSIHQGSRGPTASELRLSSTPAPQSNGGKKIVSIIIGLIIVAALGVGAYYYFFAGKLATANLTEVTVGQTTYLRPDGWEAVPLGVGIETYSDLGKGKQATTTVTIAESTASMQYYGNDRPSDWYDTVRQQAIANEKVDSIKALFRNGGKDCTSDISFSVEPDTRAANNTVGLALATGTCTREDGSYIVKRRTVTGEDGGVFRHITIGASKSDWSKNKTTYEAILHSIGQVAP